MNFYHPGSIGDIIYTLPVIIKYGGGNLFILRRYHFEMLYRVLMAQSYIHGVKEHNKKREFGKFRLDVDFDNRDVWKDDNFRRQHITKCYADFCDMTVNTEDAWLHNIEPKYKADIIVQRTYRYHDRRGTDWSDKKEVVDWRILQNYKEHVLFVGWRRDFLKFESRARFTPKRFICRDGLEFAQIIKGSKLFIGNQSLGFALAESMKHPRILEIYHARNNCLPCGEDGYTGTSHEIIQKYLQK